MRSPTTADKASAAAMTGIDWARRCRDEYAANPTPARAHNAAQQLGPTLAEIERLQAVVADMAAMARSSRTRRPAYYLTELGEQALERGA